MKIGINGFEAVVSRFGNDSSGLPIRVGSSEVCFQWLTELHKIDKKNEYVIYLPTNPAPDMPRERSGWMYKVIPNSRLWTFFGLGRELLKTSQLDVFFSPSHYSPILTRCKQIITILDLSYRRYPELFNTADLIKLNLWGKYSAKKAVKIVTISKSSKDDIINVYKVQPKKVVVSYLGIKENPRENMQKEDLFKKYSVSSPYVLFVGTIQPRKNVKRLIEAFSIVAEKKRSVSLILIGKRGWKFDEILKTPSRLGISDRVSFLHDVSNADLKFFYQNAEVFVLPSLYEGFGLPVLEAMEYGCPVITSNTSSLPEAGGEAASYVDPNSIDDIAEKITKVLDDRKFRSEMITKGKEQAKKFSWEKSARVVLDTIESISK